MNKILTTDQWRAVDALTIKQQKITSFDLMLRAAKSCFLWLQQKLDKTHKIIVFAGAGNNGGDGLVIARLFYENGFDVCCFVDDYSTKKSPDNIKNFKLLKESFCPITKIKTEKDFLDFELENCFVIDAIFGYGLSRSIEGITKKLVNYINQGKAKEIVAIDIPSGMFCSQLNSSTDAIVMATYTLTFQSPKLSFFFPEQGNNTGKVITLDIQLEQFIDDKIDYYFVAPKSVGKYLPKRKIFSHKGTFGHAGLISGQKGMMGAAVLMTAAASKSGVGLVSSFIPSIGYQVLQSNVPSAICHDVLGQNIWGKTLEFDDKYTYGIGPGIGTAAATIKALEHFIKTCKKPLVLDADALNIMSLHPEILSNIPENSILTPHIGEFRRLVGDFKDSNERLLLQKEWAIKHKVYLILKDARTIIATPEGKCYFSLNGTNGMASGGSGDVLTGLLTGLLAQGIPPFRAALLGVIIHGLAGEFAAFDKSDYAMTAMDFIENIGKAIKKLEQIKD